MSAKILIVDDDAHIRDVIKFALDDAGYSAIEAANGREGLDRVANSDVELVVLDIGMPEMDGFQMCKEMRKTSDVPVLFLTARNDEIDRVLAFELGADDFLAKPFSPRELVLRVRAILKRGHHLPQDDTQKHGDLTVNQGQHFAALSNKTMELTAREFSLLVTLINRPDQVFPKAQLMQLVYGENIYVADRTLDSHVRNLRAKARALGCDNLVETVHGVGLKLGNCKC